MSELAYIVFCQKSTAVFLLFFCLMVSHNLWDLTSELDCSQNDTLYVLLSYNPFDIIPCSLGYLPDRMLASTVDVTAGNVGSSLAVSPFSVILAIFGTRPESKCLTSRPTISSRME